MSKLDEALSKAKRVIAESEDITSQESTAEDTPTLTAPEDDHDVEAVKPALQTPAAKG